jgi:uncharacterized membrane protein YhdT
MLRSSKKPRDFKFACRLLSLVCYGLSILIVHYEYPVAAKTFNELCASQGITFNEEPSVSFLGIAFMILSTPPCLARSGILVVSNSVISLITIIGAFALPYTVRHRPYECFTVMGIYEDNTSGLDGFAEWLLLVTLLSYVLLLADLAIWLVGKLIARKRTLKQTVAI